MPTRPLRVARPRRDELVLLPVLRRLVREVPMTPRKPAAARKRRLYSPEERERGLTTLILAGSSVKASELTGITEPTLRDWKREHRDQYERLQEELEPRVVKKIAAEAESLVLQIADREAAILKSFTDVEIAGLDAKDKAATLRNLSTSKALQIDKLSSPLRERPSHVQQGRDLDQVVSAMARLVGFDATATATEIVDVVPLPSPSAPLNAQAQLSE
jgi:transposase-like protein